MVMRTFEAFSEIMTNLPYLKPIDEKRRNRLLRELYQAVVEKNFMEEVGKDLRDKLPEVRAKRKRTLKVVGLLAKALQAVMEARASDGDDLAACEREWKTSAGKSFTFAEMEKHLKFSVRFRKACVVIDAAYVHPKLRTDAEKQLATKYKSTLNSRVAKAHNLPSGAEARALDAWFIHKAAKCIDRYKRQIEGKDIIIATLFDAAFNEFRSQASVQKALKGRRKSELQYAPPMKIIYVHDDEIRESNMRGRPRMRRQ